MTNAARPISFLIRGNSYVTPASHSILPSITNKKPYATGRRYGHGSDTQANPEELNDFEEAGACGTAAVISPVARIDDADTGKSYVFSKDGKPGKVCEKLYHKLRAIQYGDEPGYLRLDYYCRVRLVPLYGKNKLKNLRICATGAMCLSFRSKSAGGLSVSSKAIGVQVFLATHHPLVLELGCGKGEYTGLGRLRPDMNFIGIDIKGARMGQGPVRLRKRPS